MSEIQMNIIQPKCANFSDKKLEKGTPALFKLSFNVLLIPTLYQ